MLFNSYLFIFLFFPLVVIIYYLIRKFTINKNLSTWFLITASLLFYAYYEVKNIYIILLSIGINYTLAKRIYNSKIYKKRYLTISIFFNLFLLFGYKYYGFLSEILINNNFNSYINPNLPLAISFFTFQQLAFILDISNEKIKLLNFRRYFIFITFFPQLIAGPIINYLDFYPQIQKNETALLPTFKNSFFLKGILYFSTGLFRKVAIADNLSNFVNKNFENISSLSCLEAWNTVLGYSLQLYFDFSGYSDMALGLMYFFGFRIKDNFRFPYSANNIQEFWSSWHISLSNFLKNYLYLPLGGNRISRFIEYRNIMLVFILGGIWHGAGFGFIIWGFLHGLYQIIFRIFRKFNIYINRKISWFITLLSVSFAWVFFKSPNLSTSLQMVEKLIDYKYLYKNYVEVLLLFIFLTVLVLMKVLQKRLYNHLFTISKKSLIYAGILFTISIMSLSSPSVFLYFQF